MKGSSVRLNVSIDVNRLTIFKGPGATRLFDSTIEKARAGYEEPTGPRLEFTVGNPLDNSMMKLTVEMIGNWDKVGDHYNLQAAIVGSGSYVLIEYWLQDDPDLVGRGNVFDI